MLVKINTRTELKVSKNSWNLMPGLYAYIGSAMNNIEKRILRHLRKNKRKHWHIDYLTEVGEVICAVMFPSENRIEETISKMFSKRFELIPGFGATDLDVDTNLFFVNKIEEFFELVDFLSFMLKGVENSVHRDPQ
ncbi:MAG: GIY-YIG nuclease family protein [Fervidobacterium sp.]|uniref:GIY-YIG nuclease family protein n=1 Tax=Fervidobacterium sp. TaxID=1871331 RepID=UPI00404B4F15